MAPASRARWRFLGGLGGLGGIATRGIRTRRKIDTAALFAVGLLATGAAAIGATIGDSERVTGMWAGLTVDGERRAHVTEVIEYDFGTQRRHGIFRDIPGLRAEDAVRAASATAPADALVDGTQVRLGDPTRTITGRHRYTIGYGVDGVVDGDAFAWDAVGTEWPVAMSDIVIHLAAPFELDSPSCVHGVASSHQACDLVQPEPGHLVVTVDRLDPHEGVTLYATLGQSVGDPPRLPAPPSGAATDPGLGRILPALLAMAFALVAAFLMVMLVRRAGRERLPAADAPGRAATAGPAGSGGEVRVDSAELASLATVASAPPAELAAPQGGVLLAEAVRDQHKVAWLVEAAIAGYIDLELDPSGEHVTLVRKRPAEGGWTRDVLDRAFAGRERVWLAAYDSRFAEAWREIGGSLEAWRGRSGLWDHSGEVRCDAARAAGALGGFTGLILAGLGGAATSRWGPAALPIVAVGALLAGAGLAALIASWELRVRTPEGVRLWLKVESFRRFLAGAGAPGGGGPRGAEPDYPDYTAWAIALGESDRWSHVALPHGAFPDRYRRYRYAHMARPLAAGAATASTTPSSSGGGGGGGGVGGGGGGGGGGSW
jgi:Predicted membrane protein (DUF2207)